MSMQAGLERSLRCPGPLVIIGIMTQPTTHPGYDAVYRGRWHYRYNSRRMAIREWWKCKHEIIDHFGIRRGARMLEVACGQGYHVHVMKRLGMRVTGVDISVEAIRFAQGQFPRCDFRHVDATQSLPFLGGEFDVIWSHGAAFFHYDVTDADTAAIIQRHLRHLKSGGLYIVAIATDQSGRKPPKGPNGWGSVVWMNYLEDYRAMFEPFERTGHLGKVDVRHVPARRWIPIVGPRMRDGLAIAGARKLH